MDELATLHMAWLYLTFEALGSLELHHEFMVKLL